MSAVLFCLVDPLDVAKATNKNLPWTRIEKNQEERFGFLQGADEGEDFLGCGLPRLVADFKQFFSVPTDEVYERIRCGELKRRSKLHGDYLRHFVSRFYRFQSREALPIPHKRN